MFLFSQETETERVTLLGSHSEWVVPEFEPSLSLTPKPELPPHCRLLAGSSALRKCHSSDPRGLEREDL